MAKRSTRDGLHADFALRLTTAADAKPSIPNGHGRYACIERALKVLGHTTTRETVRKWFNAETYPRPLMVAALAQIMDTNVGYLTDGQGAPVNSGDQPAMLGVVSLIAGMIQMNGGDVSPTSADDPADLNAMIRGGHYRLKIVLGVAEADGVRFDVPASSSDGVLTLGVVQRENLCFDVFELDVRSAEGKKTPQGAVFDPAKLHQIKSFSRRI